MSSSIPTERALIEEFLAPLAAGLPAALGLRDDAACFDPEPGEALVLTTDAIVEGVHVLEGTAPEDIAYRALAVNVSDLAAKGAVPRLYLMALALPGPPARDWFADFAKGLREAQQAFGLSLAGGDTDCRPGPLTVTIAAVGTVPSGKFVPRTGARPGDALFVTGTLGDGALGLDCLRSPHMVPRWGLDESAISFLRGRYLHPSPPLRLGSALRKFAHAAMDISDGVSKDLTTMCRASGVGATLVLDRVPLSEAAKVAIAAQPDLLLRVLTGGDDYELLVAVAPSDAGRFVTLAREAGIAATEIGRFDAGPGIWAEVADGRKVALTGEGWDHLSR